MSENKPKGPLRWVLILLVALVASGIAAVGFVSSVDPTHRGYAIRPDGEPVTATSKMHDGQYVQIERDGEWFAGKVRRVKPDGQALVHYDGWDSRYDEVVPYSRLRLTPATGNTPAANNLVEFFGLVPSSEAK